MEVSGKKGRCFQKAVVGVRDKAGQGTNSFWPYNSVSVSQKIVQHPPQGERRAFVAPNQVFQQQKGL
jgi:hypothetical protein